MDTLVIACSDGRLTAPLERFLAERDADGAHRILLPGGSLPLSRPGAERRVTLDAVRLVIEAHGVRVVHVFAHQDCRAYDRVLGGVGFDQRELLERDLRRVKTLLETTFPGVEVRAWLVPWHENGGEAGFGAPVEVE